MKQSKSALTPARLFTDHQPRLLRPGVHWVETARPEKERAARLISAVIVAVTMLAGNIIPRAREVNTMFEGEITVSECAKYHKRMSKTKKDEYVKLLTSGDCHGFDLENRKTEIELHDRIANFMDGVTLGISIIS